MTEKEKRFNELLSSLVKSFECMSEEELRQYIKENPFYIGMFTKRSTDN